MTEFGDTLPITLSPGQIAKIKADGEIAQALIAATGTGVPPVGVWQQMYDDIHLFVTENTAYRSALANVPSALEYWFTQAPCITDDQEDGRQVIPCVMSRQ